MTKAVPALIGGKYRVVKRLGQGAMGSVFEAHDPAGQRVAVKVIMTELANNATLVGRFEREARSVAEIDTPHIVRVLDAGTDAESGLPFMVMELLEGEDLDQVMRSLGPLHPDLALRVAAQASLAMRDAHQARILHRDIKPANLYLAKNAGTRVVKLLDFGVAKVRPEITRSNAETAGLTRTGSMLGSPLYMSPEQARGYKDIDFRADLWSLGVVLYKMLCGRAPHDETEELGELIILICTEPPPPIQDIAPWVAPEIAAVVHRALRFSPAERFGSAAEMYTALIQLLPGGDTIAESILRPMSAAERSMVAPRLAADLTDAPPPRKSAQSTGSGATSLPRVPPSADWGPAATGHHASHPGYPSQSGQPYAGQPIPGAPPSHPGYSSPGTPSPDSPFSSRLSRPRTPRPRSPPRTPAMPAPGQPLPGQPLSATPALDSRSPPLPRTAPRRLPRTGQLHQHHRRLRPWPRGPSSAAPARGSAVPFVVAGAVVCLAAGGFAAYKLTASPGDTPPSPAASASTTAPDDKPRTVTVVILPKDATVDVDGTATPSPRVSWRSQAPSAASTRSMSPPPAPRRQSGRRLRDRRCPPQGRDRDRRRRAHRPQRHSPPHGPRPKPRPPPPPPDDLRNKR
ncbi:MAG: protein kinase [Polyangiaceae bacterium]